jgi:transcriptional regulator with XRE-family HTH domain
MKWSNRAPDIFPAAQDLAALGRRIRERRQAQRVNATSTAEAAGISRMTLHRIERGEPSVAIGAYANVMAALGLDFNVAPKTNAGGVYAAERNHWIPARVRVADYPQLRQLAWQLKADAELTPSEALDIYERNARHLDAAALEPAEQELIDALHIALDRGRHV